MVDHPTEPRAAGPTIGHRIAAARRAAYITQEELADLLGVTANTISRWENGHVGEPSLSQAAAIARLCGVSLNWLAGVDPPTG